MQAVLIGVIFPMGDWWKSKCFTQENCVWSFTVIDVKWQLGPHFMHRI